MTTKDELAENIMDLLELDSLPSLVRMNKTDLVKMHQRLQFYKRDGELTGKPLEEVLNEEIEGKKLKDMTLKELAEKVRDSGPLGFGLLPEVRQVARREVKKMLKNLRRKEM